MLVPSFIPVSLSNVFASISLFTLFSSVLIVFISIFNVTSVFIVSAIYVVSESFLSVSYSKITLVILVFSVSIFK